MASPISNKEKKNMELTYDQVEDMRKSLQKLVALGDAVFHIGETGEPPEDVMYGWRLLIWDVADEIAKIIEPETVKGETT
jgi:hypothetical protein